MARILAEDGIETTLITDSAIFAIMSRVNKV
jgi:translation initiation factor 2B subunit (eIF-2B alpha/beta/delta family)